MYVTFLMSPGNGLIDQELITYYRQLYFSVYSVSDYSKI